MGKPAQYEGGTIDGYQQQLCGPRSALEIWRPPVTGSSTLIEEVVCHSNDFVFVPYVAPAEDMLEDWTSVSDLDNVQITALQNVATKGVFWKHPVQSISAVFTLHHGGDVEADGNCLFTASQKAMEAVQSPLEVRLSTVRRFLEDTENGLHSRQAVNDMIRHLYCPDLSSGWGVHCIQEWKLLAKQDEREALESAINELVTVGVSRETAAESIYKERAILVNDVDSWAKYMSISGTGNEEYNIITLQYTEEGLFSVDENRDGRAAAFGDDIAIECLANEFEREIFVVQAHGADVMSDKENCLFFLPHSPRNPASIRRPPMFLFMKGRNWCGAGADHYEPIIARFVPNQLKGKAAIVL